MKFIMYIFMFFGLCVQADEAKDLLLASDQARGGLGDGVSWDVRLQSWENGLESDRTFFVKAKGDDALVEAKTPAKFKGELYLFNDRTMWFFKTNLKKPIAISARQKLSGQAANGDIASTNYARDYDPKIEKTEKIGNDIYKILLLKAKSEQVTYDQIRYWISSKSKQATKAEFMTLQGEVFKIANFEYNNKIKFQNKLIPFVSKMILTDAKFSENKSIMTYSNPISEKHAGAIFNVNNLSR